MTLTNDLSAIVGDVFESEGFDRALGRVRVSDRPDLAQFQCNGALAAAKMAKKNPHAIGEALAAQLRENTIFASVDLAGPGFINLTLADDFLGGRIDALLADERLGAWRHEPAEAIVMDYGGPNVAKPLHVGHLRSAIIGEALKRLFRFAGDTVVSDIHLGDWGLQMGQLISELELRQPDLPYFEEGAEGPFPSEPPISLADLEELYPAASKACKEDKARADLARRATKALQSGRPGYRALWRHFVDLSVAAMRQNYEDLEVTFDLWKGEADADALVPEVVSDMTNKGLVEASDGAQIVRVARDTDKKEMPPLMLVNSEGAVGYHTTDIATILDRKREIDPDRILYIVDNRQSLHFEQVYRATAMAGYFEEDRLEHLNFGTMQGQDGKPFKTREGGTLKLRDMIDLVSARARARLEEGDLAAGCSEEETSDIARKVGVAALKFADLSNQRISDYIFDLDRFTAFEGKTGPYLLYASVRVRSVLRKAQDAGAGSPGRVVLSQQEERDLALTLCAFPDAMRSAYEKRMPHHLCEHAYALAQRFSKFYAACRIVDEKDEALRRSRLSLASAAGRQLDLVIELLGFSAPERM
ncbi:MAG: arginine--tRNA ligase [Pseudomonadota bacterium]